MNTESSSEDVYAIQKGNDLYAIKILTFDAISREGKRKRKERQPMWACPFHNHLCKPNKNKT